MTRPDELIPIPDAKKIRVIIDTDAACEADDPFAIAQALMSPKLIVKGILAEHFCEPGSTRKSYDEVLTVLQAMALEGNIPVFMGQEGPLDGSRDGGTAEALSPAARFIIEEAMKDAPKSGHDTKGTVPGGAECAAPGADKPLYLLCQGAITNVAAALRACPEIKDKVIIVWIGTHGSSSGKPAPFREYNAGNDITAANEVLQSGAEVWLIPADVYSTIHTGLAELKLKVAPYGKIGRHLYENMLNYNMSDRAAWTRGESWTLGDSPAIAVALNPGCGTFIEEPAPYINEDTASVSKPDSPLIRIYKSVDSRYILEDFFAKLQLNFPAEA